MRGWIVGTADFRPGWEGYVWASFPAGWRKPFCMQLLSLRKLEDIELPPSGQSPAISTSAVYRPAVLTFVSCRHSRDLDPLSEVTVGLPAESFTLFTLHRGDPCSPPHAGCQKLGRAQGVFCDTKGARPSLPLKKISFSKL